MAERYRALLLAARNLFSLTDLEDLVENILTYSCTMMQAEACSMYLPDATTKELVIYSARGKKDAINAFRIPWDKGIAGTVFQERKFMRIDDAQHDKRLLPHRRFENGLCHPRHGLRAPGRSRGMLWRAAGAQPRRPAELHRAG